MVAFLGLAAYLIGSLVGGILYSAARQEDIRAHDLPGGSGTYRQYGWRPALGVTLFDMLKGAAAVQLAQVLMPPATALAVGAVVLGHCYPAFFGGRGGGGIAPLVGSLALAAPQPLLVAVGAAALFMPFYKWVLQPHLRLNVIPVTAAAVLPLALSAAWYRESSAGEEFWSVVAGGAVMGLRAIHMLMQMRRRKSL